MPYARSKNITQTRRIIKENNMKQKKLIKSRLMVISLVADEYIYKNKPISIKDATAYAQEMETFKNQCQDERCLQVIEKLMSYMKAIINEKPSTDTADVDMTNTIENHIDEVNAEIEHIHNPNREEDCIIDLEMERSFSNLSIVESKDSLVVTYPKEPIIDKPTSADPETQCNVVSKYIESNKATKLEGNKVSFKVDQSQKQKLVGYDKMDTETKFIQQNIAEVSITTSNHNTYAKNNNNQSEIIILDDIILKDTNRVPSKPMYKYYNKSDTTVLHSNTNLRNNNIQSQYKVEDKPKVISFNYTNTITHNNQNKNINLKGIQQTDDIKIIKDSNKTTIYKNNSNAALLHSNTSIINRSIDINSKQIQDKVELNVTGFRTNANNNNQTEVINLNVLQSKHVELVDDNSKGKECEYKNAIPRNKDPIKCQTPLGNKIPNNSGAITKITNNCISNKRNRSTTSKVTKTTKHKEQADKNNSKQKNEFTFLKKKTSVVDVSWVENMKFVREIETYEYFNCDGLNESFWNDLTIPSSISSTDFEYNINVWKN